MNNKVFRILIYVFLVVLIVFLIIFSSTYKKNSDSSTNTKNLPSSFRCSYVKEDEEKKITYSYIISVDNYLQITNVVDEMAIVYTDKKDFNLANSYYKNTKVLDYETAIKEEESTYILTRKVKLTDSKKGWVKDYMEGLDSQYNCIPESYLK